jgi:hypothetical protein
MDSGKQEKMGQSHLVAKDDGRTYFRVSLLMTVYFEDAHLKEKRAGMLDLMSGFIARTGTELRWWGDANSGRWRRFDSTAVGSIRNQLELAEDSSTCSCSMHGGDTPEEPSDVEFAALGLPAGDIRGLSFLSIRLPVPQANSDSTALKEFVGMFESTCNLLLPIHGYGGFGFATSSDIGARRDSEFLVYKASQRLLGVEVDYPAVHCLYLKDRVKGGNWLTALGASFLTKLGGKQKLADTLQDGFLIKDYTGGVIIQAGHAPDLGLDHAPVLYKKLAQFLRPVRVREHGSFQSGQSSKEYLDVNSSMAWLARFD